MSNVASYTDPQPIILRYKWMNACIQNLMEFFRIMQQLLTNHGTQLSTEMFCAFHMF